MDRRHASRAQVDLPFHLMFDGHRHLCRAIDLSPSGMVFEPTRSLSQRNLGALCAFELFLGGRRIRARARSVWSKDGMQAVRFVALPDVDRLTIAEHLDRVKHRLH